MKNVSKFILSFVFALFLLVPIFVAGCKPKDNTKVVQLSSCAIEHEEEFGGVYIKSAIEDFNKLGFKYGDSVNISFSNGKELTDIPYYNGYYTQNGEKLLVAYPGYPYIKVCINNGDDLWEELDFTNGTLLAEANTLWSQLTLDANTTVSITLAESGKYLDIQEARDIHYYDDRALYPNDQVFANFRSLSGGRLKENFIFRSASPCDNQHARAKYVNDLIENAGVEYILDLADTTAKIEGYMSQADFESDYFASLYADGKVLPLALNMNFNSDYFKGQVILALKAMMEQNGPFLIHCTEGKDRTGFMCLLVEALAGATYGEIVDDYMTTYFNYYSIIKGFDSKRYNTIVENVLNPMIETIVGHSIALNENTVLEDYATAYIMQNNAMDQDEVELLKTVICGELECHIELRWDLPEEYRAYYVGEPFRTGFYVEGTYVELAPKVYLEFGDNQEVYIPYLNGNAVRMTGFDSSTPGIKHVTITVFNIDNGYGKKYHATTSYDVEVKEYDTTKYGYDVQPESVDVSFPEGYSFAAKAKNEQNVAFYSWMDSQAWDDPETHAEMCSHQNYFPYTYLTGSTAFTNTLVVPNSLNLTSEKYRLLTIYDDMTRVYTNNVVANVTKVSSEELENYARLGEIVFGTDISRGGNPFDLAEYGIGTGTISFVKTADGAEFTFTDVYYINNNYSCDAFNSSVGFEYFYVQGIDEEGNITTPGDYYIHLVGDNYFVNTYYVDKASGININFQNPRQNERLGIFNTSCLTIDGDGTLNIVGGAPGLYVNSDLIIDSKINFAPYVGRNSSGIAANEITLGSNANLNMACKGIGLTAMLGNVLIEDGAKLKMDLVVPRAEGRGAGIFAIQVAGDVIIYSDDVNITVNVTPEIYQIYDNQTEGVENIILVSAGHNIVLDQGAKVNLKVVGSNSTNTIPIFGMVYGLSADNIIYVGNNSILDIDCLTDLFYGVYAMAANTSVEIEDSTVNINMKCKYNMNGIYCENGNVGIIRSEVTIKGRSAYVHESPIFGIFVGADSSLEVINSLLDIDYNHGIAVAAYFDWRNQPVAYDEDYMPKPKLLQGFELEQGQAYGLYGVFAVTDQGETGFHTLEIVYDLADNVVPATSIHVDTRL